MDLIQTEKLDAVPIEQWRAAMPKIKDLVVDAARAQPATNPAAPSAS